MVSPRMGRVDWNHILKHLYAFYYVSPRMGRVDWNHCGNQGKAGFSVVSPRMGRVDWNPCEYSQAICSIIVSPRMGSVDWNPSVYVIAFVKVLPLPAWGAWIEIAYSLPRITFCASRSPHGERGLKFALPVSGWDRSSAAPRMGSVDWNQFLIGGLCTLLSLPIGEAWVETDLRT